MVIVHVDILMITNLITGALIRKSHLTVPKPKYAIITYKL